ncbi:LTA synthase family protein, partial [Paenibacillus darwinianus]
MTQTGAVCGGAAALLVEVEEWIRYDEEMKFEISVGGIRMPASLRYALSRPFTVFTLLIAAKFYMTSAVVFGNVGFNPLLSSLPSAWLAFGLIEALASKRKLTAYWSVNLIYTCIYFAVVMYYKYFGIIVTYHALAQVGQVTEVKGSVFQLMHPYFLLIFIDLLAIVGLWLWSKRFRLWAAEAGRPGIGHRAFFAALAAGMLAVSLTQVLSNRGIVNELKQAERMGVINYEAYAILASGMKETVDPDTVTREAVQRLKGIRPAADPVGWGAAEGRNIIFLQLEAFQNIMLDLRVDGQEVTPVLNGLKREGLYFPRFYQQVGAGNTSDSEYTANTSLYTPPAGAASAVYAGKALPSLPKLLEAMGYETMTFHTNDVNFWNRDQLYQALGFNRYYDSSFFKDEDWVHFGSSDEVLYRKTVEELARYDAQGAKFYAALVSMSGHHPFNLPPRKNKMKLPERFNDTFVGDYIRSQNYADFALGQFVDRLKAAGLWEKSMIVIYGDHMGMPIYSLTKDDRRLLEGLLKRPYDYTGMLNIPLIIVAP